MKNVNEIRKFARKGINDVKQVIDEGAKDLGNILSKVIGLIQPGRDAIEDAKMYLPELGVSTNLDMDDSDRQVQGLLAAFNEEDQRDYDAILKGTVAVTRKVARSRQQGIVEGRSQVFAEMAAAGVDFVKLGIEPK